MHDEGQDSNRRGQTVSDVIKNLDPREGAARCDADALVERRLPFNRHRDPLRAMRERDGAGGLPGLQRRPQVPDRPHRAQERPRPSGAAGVGALGEHLLHHQQHGAADHRRLREPAGVHPGHGRHGSRGGRVRPVVASPADRPVREPSRLRRPGVGPAQQRSQPAGRDRRLQRNAAVLSPPHGHGRDDEGRRQPPDGIHGPRAGPPAA